MNKWIKYYLVTTAVVLVLIFLLPWLLRHTAQDYWRTVSILLPITIAVFVVPIASFIINKRDIRFDYSKYNNGIKFTVSNLGTTPFNFNRVGFAASRKFWLFGKREYHPAAGMLDNEVECP